MFRSYSTNFNIENGLIFLWQFLNGIIIVPITHHFRKSFKLRTPAFFPSHHRKIVRQYDGNDELLLYLNQSQYSGVFSTGATGAYNLLLSPPFSTRNFGTIFYCQHPQFKSPKYASASVVMCDEFKPSWLEHSLSWKIFSSAWLVTFSIQLEIKKQLKITNVYNNR